MQQQWAATHTRNKYEHASLLIYKLSQPLCVQLYVIYQKYTHKHMYVDTHTYIVVRSNVRA